MGKVNEAIDDCTKAIELDDKYVKAYLRRAKWYVTGWRLFSAIFSVSLIANVFCAVCPFF